MTNPLEKLLLIAAILYALAYKIAGKIMGFRNSNYHIFIPADVLDARLREIPRNRKLGRGRPILEKYGIHWVMVTSEFPLHFPAEEKLKPVYKNGSATVFKYP